MKVNFRQGIIRYPTNLSGPSFLQKTSLSASAVDLVISPEPVVLTFAHNTANYLLEEVRSITGAWGGGAVGTANGPLPLNQACYLYWDVNLATAELTHGWTLIPPIVTSNEPASPEHDTHWFDTQATKMRVYRKPATGEGYWQDKVRLFAAKHESSGLITPMPIGSQVGIKDGNWSTGNIILGANNKPLKQSDGTFVTTESDLIIYQTSGQNVKFDMALVFAQAAEEIPKFFLVTFLPDRRVGLASSTNLNSFVSGIVVEDLYEDDVGQIITNGVVRNEQWNWTPEQINKPLFCGPSGQISLTPARVGVVQQVGFVYDQDSIYLNLFPPIRLR